MKCLSGIYENQRILIAAYRLPYNIIKEDNHQILKQNSGGLVSAILSLTDKISKANNEPNGKKILWFGQSEFTKNDYDKLSNDDLEFELYPVDIPKAINTEYYEGFCNDTLWPLFHYFPIYTVFKESYYDAYVKANLLFMNELEKVIQPNDIIWIHDYQLMLLPKLIKERFPKTKIGFFLHIPFPSYEIYRLLNKKWREELLRGILGADLIGFHTNDYTQHFLNTVRRTLGFDNSLRKIFTPDRIIKADAFPIGIDFDKFTNSLNEFKVVEEIDKLNEFIKDCKLIFSVDRLDYTKGIMHRLNGFEFFLEKYPEWQGKVIFNMVVAPSRDSIPRYKKMKKEIEANVGRINGKYSHLGWRPIVYQYKNINFQELVALYSLSHCGLITPLRDGMNLVAKEYVTCQGKNIGVLILSELAGAVAEMGEAIIINPTDTLEVADAILKALEMKLDERIERNDRMKKRIKSYNVFSWAEDFLNQLDFIKKEQESFDVKIMTPESIDNLISHYERSNSRLILLDYDGTLIPFSKYPDMALPDERVIQQLTKLSTDKRNTVVIVSGRDKTFLEKYFGKININLVAEHGVFYKINGNNWKIQDKDLENDTWKNVLKPILNKYTERCYGSFIEEKETALVWHYRNAEPDFAFVRANELKEELTEFLLHHKNLQLLEGNKIIEIKKMGFDKGTSVNHFLKISKFDFVLAIGDDHTDEDLFKVLPKDAYSIKVGLVQSLAKYNLTQQYEVNNLIDSLIL